MNEKDTDLETCSVYSISQNVNYPSSSLTSSTVVYHTLSLMYKITHNLIANPISDFLIPLCKTLSTLSLIILQADNCYDWWLHFFILSKSCISLEQPPPRNCGLPHLGAVQPSSLQDWPRLTIVPNMGLTLLEDRKSVS